MKTSPSRPQQKKYSQLMDEPDIGSGEKTPGQQETEEIIRQVPSLPERDEKDAASDSEP